MLSIVSHGFCSILTLIVMNRSLSLIAPRRRDCEINIFTEKFKLKKGLDSVLYCLALWLI